MSTTVLTDIYQTIEDRGNYDEVEHHGPYCCSLSDSRGILKHGTKEPWLGEGYYFWDTRIGDARWWGETIYSRKFKGYVVCHTKYDQHSPLLFDMVGSVAMFDEFERCVELIKAERRTERVNFPFVLEFMKRHGDFPYKAIRVWPYPDIKTSNSQIDVFFPGDKATVRRFEKIQICFFDKTLLNQPFTIVEKHPFNAGYIV
ncbi:MAG: hypothetical protein VZR53_12010 [Prevotella sp.]|nr:hypothetical protein [Prevotella sp.]